MNDALTEYVNELCADEATLGLLLHGSRALGFERPNSDYDLIRIVSDDSYTHRKATGELLQRHRLVDGSMADVLYQSPGHLRELARQPDWSTATYISARVLLDKTGELTELLALIVDAASRAVAARVSDEYDAYLNSWVRSIKAWRRGDELGGRLHAAASVYPLLRALFGLERQWPPYHDQLEERLAELERLQGWGTSELRTQIVALLERGAPDVQQRLQTKVEASSIHAVSRTNGATTSSRSSGWSCRAAPRSRIHGPPTSRATRSASSAVRNSRIRIRCLSSAFATRAASAPASTTSRTTSDGPSRSHRPPGHASGGG